MSLFQEAFERGLTLVLGTTCRAQFKGGCMRAPLAPVSSPSAEASDTLLTIDKM